MFLALILKKLYYILGAVALIVLVLVMANTEGDFKIFLAASTDLLDKKDIYTIHYIDGFRYYYDVLFALLLVPFIKMPLYVTQVLWITLNIFFLYRIWKIISNWLGLRILENKTRLVFTIISFVFVFDLINRNLHLSQLSIFMLYVCMESVHLVSTGRKFGGGLLLAFGITVKLLPLVIVPYLLFKKEFKATIMTVAFIVVLLFLPALIVGFEYNNFLLSSRWELINPMNKQHVMDAEERSFHSLSTLLSTLLVKNVGDPHAMTLRRHVADVSLSTLSLVLNAARAAFVLFTFYFLQSFALKKYSGIKRLYEVSYLLVAAPLLFPHQQHYAFVMIMPAVCYLLFYYYIVFMRGNATPDNNFKMKRFFFAAALFLIFLSVNAHFLLGVFDNYYEHFKTLTYGILLLVALLAVSTPKKLSLVAPLATG